LLDQNTGKSRVRVVNVANPSYKIAREYMIRLEKEDFDDGEKLRLLAEAASSFSQRCTPEEFRSRFQHLIAAEN
jgi:ATP-dependent phosphofructokinase / diphosphate-dependent phosphofructokinase